VARAHLLFFSCLLVFGPATTAHATAAPAPAPASVSEGAVAKKKKKKRKGRKGRKGTRKRSGSRPASGAVQIPIDVGVGPVAILPSPPLLLEQPVFTAATISIAAIVDRATIQKYKDRIPRQYREAASRVSRVEVTPWWLKLIPETLIISPDILPGVTNTGMYGAIWRPIGIGLTIVDTPVRLSTNASLALTYVYIHSQTRPDTHFLRPGLTLDGVLEVPLSENLLVSTGWVSDFYIPQPLGGAPWEVLPWETWLWHLGGPFFKVHIRFPYEVSL
jgi:hypothetical protein